MLFTSIYRTGTYTWIMSQLKVPSYLLLILISLHSTQARSVDSQNDDLREYLGRVDEKVRTLMTMMAPERSMPPLPHKVTNRKDLPNVHPWRSLDESNYGPVDQWQERLLAKHRQQQRSSSGYTQDQLILRQISREVDKITLLVKSLGRSSDTSDTSLSASRASRYTQDKSSQNSFGFDDDIVEPEKPWRIQEARSKIKRTELKLLLRDLERTLRVVENLQAEDDDALNQNDKDLDDAQGQVSTSAEDQGEKELMKLLEENSKQGTSQKDTPKVAVTEQNQAAKTDTTHTQTTDTDKKAAHTPSTSGQMKENQNEAQGNKEQVKKTLKKLMTDMEELENQVSSSKQQSQAQKLHERILQLAEKMGDAPR